MLDNLAGPNSGAVIRVDPITGAQQPIASNLTPAAGCSTSPSGSRSTADGTIVVVNRALTGALPLNCLLGTGSVFKVDRRPACRRRSPTRGRLAYPLGVAIAGDGSIIVANECGGAGADGLVRVRDGLRRSR